MVKRFDLGQHLREWPEIYCRVIVADYEIRHGLPFYFRWL